MSSSKQTKQLETSRVNAELVKLSYGALVAQLFRDYGQPAEVNKRLSTIGYNMGVRLVEDFIAHHSVDRLAISARFFSSMTQESEDHTRVEHFAARACKEKLLKLKFHFFI